MTNSTSDIGCNYVNLHTSPMYLITAGSVLYILQTKDSMLSCFSISDDLNHKFADYCTHCNYIASCVQPEFEGFKVSRSCSRVSYNCFNHA